MIDLNHVYKTYPGPVHAISDLSFSIGKGEFVFLTGRSGAGKSTLFKLLCGFEMATSGTISVGRQDLSSLKDVSAYRRKIGVVFQDFKLIRDASVFYNVSLPLLNRGDSTAAIQKRVLTMLEKVGLSHVANAHPSTLSGGEQQRAALARALIHQPDLVIADEPTGNLDPALSLEIMEIFKTACVQGTTLFVATHDHNLLKFGDRVLNLDKGRMQHSAGAHL